MEEIKALHCREQHRSKNSLNICYIFYIVICVIACVCVAKIFTAYDRFFILPDLHLGTYAIEPIFVYYAVFLLFMCFAKNRLYAMTLIYISFFVLFICSRNGADYQSYKEIYENVAAGVSYKNIHSETLYLVLNEIASSVMTFDVFKIIFQGFFTLLLVYGLYKISFNPMFAFLMMFCGATLYLMTILRQFATISLFFYSLHLLAKKKEIKALLITFLSGFLHVCGFVGFIIIVYLAFSRRIPKISFYRAMLMLVAAMCFRFIMYYLLQQSFVIAVIGKITVYTDVRLFTFGVLSRIAEFILIVASNKFFKFQPQYQKLFFIYYIFSLIYIAIPLEFFMARLFIILRFITALLVSVLCLSKRVATDIRLKNSFAIQESRGIAIIFIMFYYILFIYQLMFQVGYTPYQSMIF